MNWEKITSVEDLKSIDKNSENQEVMIFKHSTTCSISATVLARMERKWNAEKANKIIPYYLDLLSFREISNRIAQHYGIRHESPQVLIIKNGKCIYDASHYDISFDEVIAIASSHAF
ncbi:MAG: bacillithiol system redox-active protein YtxJ [Cytophagales bacterium]|nr:MAG: bacillithiol system redox-active protein YtxJ [Cytophagales bacterium]